MANPAKTINRTQSFGAFGQASNHQVMAGFPNYFTTVDAAATPVVSPIASVPQTVTKLTIPAGAVQLVIKTTAALRVSEDPLMTGYDVIFANAEETYPCVSPYSDTVIANTGSIYIQSDTATLARVAFKFICV